MPTGADVRMGRKEGRKENSEQGDSITSAGSQARSSTSAYQPSLGRKGSREGAVAKSSGCLQAPSGTLPTRNARLGMEGFKACVEKAG